MSCSVLFVVVVVCLVMVCRYVVIICVKVLL